jgi:hypothetical protein
MTMTTKTTTKKQTTKTSTKKTSAKKAAAKKTSKATPSKKATTKPDHANARTAAGERARKEAIAIAQANIERIEAGEQGAARHSPAHAARVANGEIRLGKDATAPNDATRANVGANAGNDGQRRKLSFAKEPGKCLDAILKAQRKAAKAAKVSAKANGQTNLEAKVAKPKPDAARKSDAARKPSGLDLAAKVLAEAREPLSAKAIAERAIAAGWVTSGKTPHATLYAAIIREIASKGDAARFTKTDRGLFEAGPSTKKGA